MKKVLAIVLLVFIIAVSGCVKQEPNTIKYHGEVLHFRTSLGEAEKIPVYPNESAIRQVLLNPYVKKVSIAYVPKEGANGFFAVDGFELAYKLTFFYGVNFGEKIPIVSTPLNSTDEINSTFENPVILMLGPGESNTTRVVVDGYTIRLEAKDFSEANRKYTDLDLATDKLLLVLFR